MKLNNNKVHDDRVELSLMKSNLLKNQVPEYFVSQSAILARDLG